MSRIVIPAGYRMPLTNNELQHAIEQIKSDFQKNLSERLNLHRVSAPLFVDGRSGLNDNLNGVERPVVFDIPAIGGEGQVVQSLAKWKRLALKRYEFKLGTGLFTDMSLLEVSHLKKVYTTRFGGNQVEALRNVTFSVEEGEYVAIMSTSTKLQKRSRSWFRPWSWYGCSAPARRPVWAPSGWRVWPPNIRMW